MQIKRLLNDREVFVGDRVFDAQGRSYTFLEHFKLEMLGRELGLISGSLVGRETSGAIKLQNVDLVRLLWALQRRHRMRPPASNITSSLPSFITTPSKLNLYYAISALFSFHKY